jgi:trimeric autotransporter adhesin
MKIEFRGLVLWSMMALMGAFSAEVYAATIVVTSVSDSGRGTLRQAILRANATPGADTITFSFPWGGVTTITPLYELPAITDTVTINGRINKSGVPRGAPTVELDGTMVGKKYKGLWLKASFCVIKGLIINRFGAGITVDGYGNKIDYNYIGTNASGTIALGNNIGVDVAGGDNGVGYIGMNLISGNNIGIALGLDPKRGGSYSNSIWNNYVGTDITGFTSLPNVVGIKVGIFSDTDYIGGQYQGNIISGNDIGIQSAGTSTRIWGNFIGTDITGAAPLSGARPGNQVAISVSGYHHWIGYRVPGYGNVIAFNQHGVVVNSGYANLINGNSIFSQSIGLGIDLAPIGVTLNDPGDVDTGPNYLINFPELSDAVSDGAITIISGTIFAASPCPNIDVYSSPQCHPSGYGEGKTYLGTINPGDYADPHRFVATLPIGVPNGHFIAATGEDPGGTSEFSRCIQVHYPF